MQQVEPARRPGGRHAEAIANDQRILEAGLQVLIADPHAPITAIAEGAGVGVASLYRRFSSRDALVRRLALHAMTSLAQEARSHRQQLRSDPWPIFVDFIASAMACGAGSMTAFAGTFDPGEDLNAAGTDLNIALTELLEEAQRLGAVRIDVNSLDMMQLFQMLRAVHIGSATRDDELRGRYMDLLLPSLRPACAQPLRGPEPSWQENLWTWNRERKEFSAASGADLE